MSFINGLVTFTNGALIYLRGIQRAPFDPKSIQDDLQTSQNNFPTSLGNFIPSANNTTTFPHPSGNGRINGASKLHCCYERITEGPKFPSENRFGSRMLIQSSPTILVTVPSLARKIARSALSIMVQGHPVVAQGQPIMVQGHPIVAQGQSH